MNIQAMVNHSTGSTPNVLQLLHEINLRVDVLYGMPAVKLFLWHQGIFNHCSTNFGRSELQPEPTCVVHRDGRRSCMMWVQSCKLLMSVAWCSRRMWPSNWDKVRSYVHSSRDLIWSPKCCLHMFTRYKTRRNPSTSSWLAEGMWGKCSAILGM